MANEVVVEDENEGTILTFDDAENVSAEDIMYLLQGTGSNRDRKIKLDALMAFLVANQKFTELKLVKDSSNNITIKWDETNNELGSEFVIWERSNENGKVVAVPKFHAYGNATFEEDVSVKADLAVDKTLSVTQGSTFGGIAEFNNYIISKLGLDAKGKSVFERLNIGSNKSCFTVSTDTDINQLLENTSIDVSEGDIVVLYNNIGGVGGDITVTLGTMTESNVTEHKTMTLKGFCAMQFICVYKAVTQGDKSTQWAPLGNATVTWA